MIERETLASRPTELSDPEVLYTSRRAVDERAERLRKLGEKTDRVAQLLADFPSRSIWERLRGIANPERLALEVHLQQLQRKFLIARADHRAAKHALRIEERKFEIARTRHEIDLSVGQAQAQGRITAAQAAKRFLERHPRAAFWGAAYLMRIAADIRKARSGWETDPDAPPDCDLIPVLDLWGIPYQSRPRIA